jgi:hypothetical protein
VASPDLCPVCGVVEQLSFLEGFYTSASWSHRPLFPNLSGNAPPKWAVAADIHHAAASLELPLFRENGMACFTGHALRATGAIFYSLGGVELAIIQLFARWGSDAFRLYVLEAPLVRAVNIAAVAHAALGSNVAPAILPAAPVIVLPAIPAARLGARINRLPLDGDDLVVNTDASGSAVARAEGRLHAVLASHPSFTVCGWPHAGLPHARLTTSCDTGVICGSCFNLRGGAIVVGDGSSDSGANQ